MQYHALSLCVGGKTWCGAGGAGRGGAKLPLAYKRQKFSDMQLSGPLLARLRAILDAPDGDVARASRLAPYALRLRCAEPVGAWPEWNASCSAATSPYPASASAAASPSSACSARNNSSKGTHPNQGADSGHLRLSSGRSSPAPPPPPPRSLLSGLPRDAQRERAQRISAYYQRSLRARSQGVVRSHQWPMWPHQPPRNRTRPGAFPRPGASSRSGNPRSRTIGGRRGTASRRQGDKNSDIRR